MNLKPSDFPTPPIQPLLWGYQLKPFGKCDRCGVYTHALHHQVYQTGPKTSQFTDHALCQEDFARQHWNFLYSGQHPFPLNSRCSGGPPSVYIASAQHCGSSLLRSILFQSGLPTPSRDAMQGGGSGPFGENRWAMEIGIHIAAKEGKQPHTFTPDDDLVALASRHADMVHSFGTTCRGVVTSLIGHPHLFYLAHALTDYGKVIVTEKDMRKVEASVTKVDLPDPAAFAAAVDKYVKALPTTAHKPENLLIINLEELATNPQEQLQRLSQFLRRPMPHHTSTYIDKACI